MRSSYTARPNSWRTGREAVSGGGWGTSGSHLADTECCEEPLVTGLWDRNMNKLFSVLVNVGIEPAPIPVPIVIVVVITVVARHPVPETKTNERN